MRRLASLAAISGLAMAQVQFDAYSKTAPQHSAAEVLGKAIHALENVKSMEYEVRMLPASRPAKDPEFTGRTTVIGTPGTPIQYRARFASGDPPAVVLAVSNGDKLRVSDRGTLSENQTRVMEEEASEAALPTLQMFDVKRYRKALAEKNSLYAGQDDVEGELCYVIAISTPFNGEIGGDTTYFWISAATGLPRSRQMFRVVHGRTMTTSRWILSNIRLNVDIPPETFLYHLTVADSVTPGAAAVSQVETTAKPGEEVPDLEVRDADYKAVSLKKAVSGKATIVTLWAPWCAPCVAEFTVFEKLIELNAGKLQVIAVGVSDSRLALVEYARRHPELKFTFLSDPNLETLDSKLQRFFTGQGIPRNLFVNADGKIHEYAQGYDGNEVELIRKVESWLNGTAANRD